MGTRREQTTTIVGTGKLARTLAPLLRAAGFRLRAVVGRRIGAARSVCRGLRDVRATTSLRKGVAEATTLLDSDVSLLDWGDLQYIDIGSSKATQFSDQRLLRFPEFLVRVGSHARKAFVELKGGDTEMIEPAADAAEAAFAAGHFDENLLTWISFDLSLMAAMKVRLPVGRPRSALLIPYTNLLESISLI